MDKRIFRGVKEPKKNGAKRKQNKTKSVLPLDKSLIMYYTYI
jgi:hypothetical protein